MGVGGAVGGACGTGGGGATALEAAGGAGITLEIKTHNMSAHTNALAVVWKTQKRQYSRKRTAAHSSTLITGSALKKK